MTKQNSLGRARRWCGTAWVLWTDFPVHVIDFEGSVRTGIVEYGVVTLVGGCIESASTGKCRPRRAVPADEARVHGLGGKDLAQWETFETQWERFAGLRRTGVLAAHFSSAEDSMLRSYWAYPRLSPDWLEPGREIAEWGPWIDTGRIAFTNASGGQSAALDEVVNSLGLSEGLSEAAAAFCPDDRCCYHCALYDALACALVMRRLAISDTEGPWTLARLLAASTANPATRERRSQPRLPGF